MKLTIKSLKQVPYELEVESDNLTILDLKKEFEKLHGFDHSTVKLVFAGAILDDTKTLSQCNIKEGNVVVMMSAKAKPVNTQKEEVKSEEKPLSQVQPQTTTTNTQQQVPQSQPAKDYSEQVKNLMDMGFPKNEAEAAIKAARGDISLAIEFLYNGIPEGLPEDDQSGLGLSSESPNAVLKGLASLVKIMCHNNPSQLQNILLTIQQNSPESFELIRQNEDEFKALLQQPVTEEDMRVFQQFNQQGDLLGGQRAQGTNSTGSEGRRDVIKLSKEDYEAVNRLKEMGFSEMDAVQAYFACDKNEDMAANLLFDNKLKEQEGEFYIDCI